MGDSLSYLDNLLLLINITTTIGLQAGSVKVRRRASAALISSWVYKLTAGKGCLESLEDAGKSDAVVSAAGEAGSVTSEGDADSKGTLSSMESSNGVEEVNVVRSSGSNPPSGDPDGQVTQTAGNSWGHGFQRSQGQ